uniref:Phosphoglycerate kinase (PGK, pgk) n=1 Tax=uncultured marine thaumarchaeote KM3_04_E09 TaxID=1455966 RepID=A0A075G889_9ARCH|nr:Phosphoglycerate kinase (PGK, pgk) [uncultured marine thaumarchaeote KM3_04_E09]
MNCPIDPDTLEISGAKRIEEIVETINSLNSAKIVIASHQGRVVIKIILVWKNTRKYLKSC